MNNNSIKLNDIGTGDFDIRTGFNDIVAGLFDITTGEMYLKTPNNNIFDLPYNFLIVF